MKASDNSKEIDFEAGIEKRMDALIARKRADNEATVARIGALDTGWQDLNGDIDKELKSGLATSENEAAAMRDAKERLKRNVCEGVGKNAFGLAGKVVDTESKVGLPGLTVTLALDDKSEPQKEQTNNYGDFFFSLPLDVARAAAGKPLSVLLVVTLDDTVVYREQRSIEPKPGAIEHLTVAVECSGRLKDVLEHGKQVTTGVEEDAKLVERRAANFNDAYGTFKRLSDTTLSRLRELKEEISSGQPAPTARTAAAPRAETTAVAKTRYLGNSRIREVHDLEKVKKQCQIDEIAPDRQVYFRTEREAVAAGYDYCRYCFGKQKSKR